MRVLLLEDDRLLGQGLAAAMRGEGYTVDWFTDGRTGENALADHAYALVILDLGLPGRDGLQVLQNLRARRDAVPVLILTARDTVADRVQGLDSGADDYLVKPFDLDELLARARALIRRREGRAEPLLTHGELVLDPAAHAVTLGGAPILLSAREFALLRLLLEEQGRVLSKERLADQLYGWDGEPDSNTIEVYIHHLRRKLGPDRIRTIRGAGYTIPKAP